MISVVIYKINETDSANLKIKVEQRTNEKII